MFSWTNNINANYVEEIYRRNATIMLLSNPPLVFVITAKRYLKLSSSNCRLSLAKKVSQKLKVCAGAQK